MVSFLTMFSTRCAMAVALAWGVAEGDADLEARCAARQAGDLHRLGDLFCRFHVGLHLLRSTACLGFFRLG